MVFYFAVANPDPEIMASRTVQCHTLYPLLDMTSGLAFITSVLLYLYRCPRRNVPDFGRVFLMLKYNDITQNTYVQI